MITLAKILISLNGNRNADIKDYCDPSNDGSAPESTKKKTVCFRENCTSNQLQANLQEKIS